MLDLNPSKNQNEVENKDNLGPGESSKKNTAEIRGSLTFSPLCVFLQVELTGSSVFDYIHPGDHVEMAEQLGMKLPPGRGMSLSQGAVNEDGASSASSSSHSETPEPGRIWGRAGEGLRCGLTGEMGGGG